MSRSVATGDRRRAVLARLPFRSVISLSTIQVLTLLAAFSGWCGYASFVLWNAFAGPPSGWNDSKLYAAVAAKPLTSSAFWLGVRPPFIPLAMKIVGSSTGFVVTQSIIAITAWTFLAWTTRRMLPPGWRRLLAWFAILGFASTLPIVLWNRSILSESLSLSIVALIVASLLWVSLQITWPRVAATTGLCLCFVAARDAQAWTVGFLSMVAGVYALVVLRRNRYLAIRVGTLAVCLLTLFAFAEWGAVSSGRSKQDIADVFYVRIFPYPNRVAWFAQHGMPQEGAVNALAALISPSPQGAAKVVEPPPGDPSFRSLEHWMADSAEHGYILWLFTHPSYALFEPISRPEQAYNFANGDLAYYAPSNERNVSSLTDALWPPLVWLILTASFAMACAMWSRAWRTPPWRVGALLIVVGVIAMLVSWQGDGQEVTRHTVEGFAQVRLGILLILIFGTLNGRRHQLNRDPPREFCSAPARA